VSVTVDRDDAVVILTIDRPDALNALDVATLTSLREELLELRADDATRAIVLTGAGDRAFAAGADIKYMSRLDVEEAKEWGELGQNVGHLLETSPKPTIAAVNGFALGGGCELALACDLRYASRTAKLGQPEINLGIIPGWGGTQRLARICGVGVAKDLILTGRVVDAGEAFRLGLVDAVVGPAELMERALATARELAAKSPLALHAAKIAINHALQGDHVENLGREVDQFGELFAGEDAKEGLAAFVEKRDARFVGR
jgi:enoyl-CoA hydratase